MLSSEFIKTIGDKLRAAREKQERSIDDIALATRIGRKFLVDIEQGILPSVPITYVRAFITDYAREVGLDPVELLHEEEPISSKEETSNRIISYGDKKETVPANLSLPTQSVPVKKFHEHQLRILFVLIIVIVVGLILTIFWLRQSNTRNPSQEISFSEIIKEQEQKINPVSARKDSATLFDHSSKIDVRRDSLFLDAVASESVWVRISIDGGSTLEYTIPRFYKKQWRAKKSLLLSLGNAAAISFTLNGQRLGTLSPTKRPMKNVSLNWETLDRMKKKYPER